MVVTVYNKTEKGSDIIGAFSIDITSNAVLSEKPQFFNVINEEGQFMGQILANFFVNFYPKDPKTRHDKNYQHPEHKRIMSQYKEISKVKWTNNKIQFSLLGIRNLIRKA